MKVMLAIVLGSILFLGCATLNSKGDLETLKPTITQMHEHLRWKDFRSFADGLPDEKRLAFLMQRKQTKDDKDLQINDYQLEDIQVSPDVKTALAHSTISWVKLPSSSVQSDSVASLFSWKNGRWQLESMIGGPFADLAPKMPAEKIDTEKKDAR